MISFSNRMKSIKDEAIEYIKNKVDEHGKIKIPAGYYFDDIIGETMEVKMAFKRKDLYYIRAIDSFGIENADYTIDSDLYHEIELLCNIADEITTIKNKENV